MLKSSPSKERRAASSSVGEKVERACCDPDCPGRVIERTAQRTGNKLITSTDWSLKEDSCSVPYVKLVDPTKPGTTYPIYCQSLLNQSALGHRRGETGSTRIILTVRKFSEISRTIVTPRHSYFLRHSALGGVHPVALFLVDMAVYAECTCPCVLQLSCVNRNE